VADFVVFAVGADRPGIVAAVTGALFERGTNLADCSMTILAGQFAMVLLVESADDVEAVDVEEALAAPAAAFDLVVVVRPVHPGHRTSTARPHVVSVYGADRPGIVHHVASAVAELGANITDLATRVVAGEGGTPVYAMLLEVSLPDGVPLAEAQARLSELAADLGVEATVRPDDADVL
jgi:glycine cleavage system transcriptional repressor